MAEQLISYLTQWFTAPDRLRARLDVPMLLWSSESVSQEQGNEEEATRASTRDGKPVGGETYVFPLRKKPETVPLLPGIRLGRVPRNDVAINDLSVSRFHALFQQDRSTLEWLVTDADSTAGILVNGTRIAPSTPTPLPADATIRLGDVELRFLTPEAFCTFLEATRRKAAGGS